MIETMYFISEMTNAFDCVASSHVKMQFLISNEVPDVNSSSHCAAFSHNFPTHQLIATQTLVLIFWSLTPEKDSCSQLCGSDPRKCCCPEDSGE